MGVQWGIGLQRLRAQGRGQPEGTACPCAGGWKARSEELDSVDLSGWPEQQRNAQHVLGLAWPE